MPQEKCEAVVLRGVDFSETSRIVTFLTPNHGRMACIAKGVRRKNGAFSGMLDTFNHVELVYYWKDGRDVQTVAEISLVENFPGIKGNIEKSACAAFPLEIAWKSAHENEPSSPLFQDLLNGLYGLEHWNGSVLWHLCWQLQSLLATLGLAPELEICVHSGKVVNGACRFTWEGGVCLEGPFQSRLSAAGLEALRTMRRESEQCPAEEATGGTVVGTEIYKLLRQYAVHQLEQDFRSARVIEQILQP